MPAGRLLPWPLAGATTYQRCIVPFCLIPEKPSPTGFTSSGVFHRKALVGVESVCYIAAGSNTVGQDILTDYTLIGENCGLARNGQQLFAVLKFKKGVGDIALSLGFRNSYDKSMTVDLCCGASVFVCDNLALHGQIAVGVMQRPQSQLADFYREMGELFSVSLTRDTAPILNRQGGLQRVASVDGLTSRKRFGRAAPKGAAAGDSRPVPAGLGRVGTE